MGQEGEVEDEEITALVEIDETLAEIDRMEQDYLKEYYILVEKDKADGKDFNKLRHDIMVDAQDRFRFMRKEIKDSIADQVKETRQSKQHKAVVAKVPSSQPLEEQSATLKAKMVMTAK